MNIFVQTLKFIAILSLIFSYAFVSSLLALFYRKKWARTQARSKTLSLFCRWGLKVMGVSLKVKGKNYDFTKDNKLIVSNHLSYLDILVVAAITPTCFVTSEEIRQTFFLGTLCEFAGCLFVDRRTRKNLALEINEITDGLENNVNVTIFPEATSTNGDEVLRFKQPLYSAAIFAEKKIQPICLNYRSINNEYISSQNRDLIFWYDKMPFFSHLWNLLGQKNINVEVDYLEVLTTEKDKKTKYYAEKSHQLITERYIPCPV